MRAISWGDLLPVEPSSLVGSADCFTALPSTGSPEVFSLNAGLLPEGNTPGLSVPDLSPLSPSPVMGDLLVSPTADPSSEATRALAAPLPTASITTQANYLRQGYWSFNGTNPRSFNLSTTGTGAQSQSRTLIYSYLGFSNITGAGSDADGVAANRRPIIERVLQDIGRTCNITFRPKAAGDVADQVDLYFKDNDSGAYSSTQRFGSGDASFYDNHRYIDYSWVNVARNWYGSSTAENDYVYQTYYHETLHALGLGHAGAYNGSATYITDSTQATSNNNVYINDSWEMSIMSYMSQADNTAIPGTSQNFVITGMAADVAALRSYYGGTSFTGNTIYGVGTNITATESYMLNKLSAFAGTNAFCIVDDGGIDTVNFSNFSANQSLDLTISSESSTANYGNITSDIGGKRRNMTLAAGTVIENAVLGSGADTIIGNTANNILQGNRGADTYTTGAGLDQVNLRFGSSVASSDSTVTSMDKIIDFNYLSDKIDLLTNVGAALAAPVSLSRIADNSSAASASALATSMFSGLAANGARLCLSTNAALNGRFFLAINDSLASYSSSRDLFLEVTGISSLPAVGAMTVGDMFV